VDVPYGPYKLLDQSVGNLVVYDHINTSIDALGFIPLHSNGSPIKAEKIFGSIPVKLVGGFVQTHHTTFG